MNVSLTPRLEQMIRDKVESGLYNNASEVVREALRLLDAHEREMHYRLDAARKAGLKDIEEGRTVPMTREYFDRIVAEGIARANTDAPLNPDEVPYEWLPQEEVES
jgi:antitoxin ParD1/3/4